MFDAIQNLDITLFSCISILLLSFVAGFIDAVVGGGGLIQLPALLINFPKTPLPILMGTNKIAALSGTSIAAYQYSKKVKFNFPLLISIAAACALSSFAGAHTIQFINTNSIKPFILILLIGIAIYTFMKKDLGSFQSKTLTPKLIYTYGILTGLIVGFYDGFFGPGTGSFFVLSFVVFLGFDFLQASAYAKVVNCVTNLSALMVFLKQGNYFGVLALLMAICNIMGNILGSRLALRKGNSFIRIIFLVIVCLLIVRYGYDVFLNS